MFNMQVTFNTDPVGYFQDMADWLRRAEDELFFAVAEAHGVTMPPTLELLRFTPPKPNRPIEYLHERQRRAARRRMVLLGNFPYRRTGKYAQGWSIQLMRATGYSRLSLGNATTDGTGINYPRYVGGDPNPSGAIVHQQPFHQITGWRPTAPIVQTWADETIALVVKSFRARMAAMAKIKRAPVSIGVSPSASVAPSSGYAYVGEYEL